MIKNKPKLGLYRQFKKTFETQNYVNLNMSKYQRSLTAKLRMGILPLALETGRYTNIALKERGCFYCNGEIEDELHFICNCKLYRKYRETLFESMAKVFTDFSEMSVKEKFLKIMETDLRCLHIYIEKAWSLRKSYVYVSSQPSLKDTDSSNITTVL